MPETGPGINRKSRRPLSKTVLAWPKSAGYPRLMSATTIAKRFNSAFTLRPLEGRPNVSVIRARAENWPRAKPGGGKGRRREMSEQEWDKFEKDIADAFEQVP